VWRRLLVPGTVSLKKFHQILQIAHDEMLDWIGGDFDPDYFEAEEVNEELAGIRGL
jgi:hypothetical protein